MDWWGYLPLASALTVFRVACQFDANIFCNIQYDNDN